MSMAIETGPRGQSKSTIKMVRCIPECCISPVSDPHAKSLRALLESMFAAFENVTDAGTNVRVFETTRDIGNLGQLAGPMRAARCYDHLIGVRIDDEISVVRDDDDLAPLLGASEAGD